MRAKIEELKQATIAEIRSYSDPPASVGEVMRATFLLLGESHADMQVRCNALSYSEIGGTGQRVRVRNRTRDFQHFGHGFRDVENLKSRTWIRPCVSAELWC